MFEYVVNRFVSTLAFFENLIIFQKVFSKKLSYFFFMFSSNLKMSWKLSLYLSYLVSLEIELFSLLRFV